MKQYVKGYVLKDPPKTTRNTNINIPGGLLSAWSSVSSHTKDERIHTDAGPNDNEGMLEEGASGMQRAKSMQNLDALNQGNGNFVTVKPQEYTLNYTNRNFVTID